MMRVSAVAIGAALVAAALIMALGLSLGIPSEKAGALGIGVALLACAATFALARLVPAMPLYDKRGKVTGVPRNAIQPNRAQRRAAKYRKRAAQHTKPPAVKAR